LVDADQHEKPTAEVKAEAATASVALPQVKKSTKVYGRSNRKDDWYHPVGIILYPKAEGSLKICIKN
jgi:hypothetical protein